MILVSNGEKREKDWSMAEWSKSRYVVYVFCIEFTILQGIFLRLWACMIIQVMRKNRYVNIV